MTASYAATCNPPRRVKRPRTDTLDSTTSAAQDTSTTRSTATGRRRPTILPKDQFPGHSSPVMDPTDSDSAEEDEYEPEAKGTTQKRRGRKPGPISRSARESLRKLNHSRIEKARRTKINETLSTLSTLVNEAEQQKATAAGLSPPEKKGKGKAEEKEFKLDVLVKTVAYVEELLERVKSLEDANRACPNCSRDRVAGSTISLKRKRVREVEPAPDVDTAPGDDDDEEVDYAGDDEKGDIDGEGAAQSRSSPATGGGTVISARPTPSPRLPSIAAWLPHPYVDPSCIAVLSDSRTGASQLPSPPLSGRFRPASIVAARDVPALTLPAPAYPLPASVCERSAKAAEQVRGERRASVTSRSPTWTPEDETAASLLLQMSGSPASTRSGSAPTSSSSSVGSMASLTLPKAMDVLPARRMSITHFAAGESQRSAVVTSMQAQTPGSLLGLGR